MFINLNGYDGHILPKLLLISDFLNNKDIIKQLIQNNVYDKIIKNNDDNSKNNNNTINSKIKRNLEDLLDLCFKKLNFCSEHMIECDLIWFDLFYFLMNYISENICSEEIKIENLISKLDSKLIEEIIEKFILNSICKSKVNCLSEQSLNVFSRKPFNKILKLLFYLNNVNQLSKNDQRIEKEEEDLFVLLKNLLLKISDRNSFNNNNNFNDLASDLDILIPYNEDNFYSEYNLKLEGSIEVTLIIYYKKEDDSLRVNLKLGKEFLTLKRNEFQIFSFQVQCFLTNNNLNLNNNINNFNAKHLDKFSKVNIFKIQNYSNFISNLNDKNDLEESSYVYNNNKKEDVNTSRKLNLKVNIKFSSIFSSLLNFLIFNFEQFCFNEKIKFLSRNLFILIIKNKNLQIKSEDHLLISIMGWCKFFNSLILFF